MRLKFRALALCLTLTTAPAFADPLALIVGPSADPDVTNYGLGLVTEASNALENAGIRTEVLRDGSRSEMVSALSDFADAREGADGLLVILAGRFAHAGGETVLIPREARGDSLVDVMTGSIPVSLVTTLLGGTSEPAVLVLATDGQAEPAAGLEAGVGDLDIPQGVTVVEGRAAPVLALMREVLSQPGTPIASAEDVEISGTDGALAFLPDGTEAGTGAGAPDGGSSAASDLATWRAAEREDTIAAYESYLQRYPRGLFAERARDRIGALDTPEARAEREEAALGLDRGARQDIQRDLTLLGYDTRGIDGIFGSGTRGAIRSWQGANDRFESGYLTAEGIDILARQADRRQAELDAEAERRRAEIRAADENLWAATDQGAPDALAAYLEEFPDGLHAGEARRRLADLGAETDSGRRERQLWQAVAQADTRESYEQFLRAFPDGAYAADARAALARLDQGQGGLARPAPEESAAAADEEALGLTDATRRAVETRLGQLDLNPGPVDGQFTGETRAALRRYQEEAGLPVTGYVNQITAVRLLADTLRGLLE